MSPCSGSVAVVAELPIFALAAREENLMRQPQPPAREASMYLALSVVVKGEAPRANDSICSGPSAEVT